MYAPSSKGLSTNIVASSTRTITVIINVVIIVLVVANNVLVTMVRRIMIIIAMAPKVHTRLLLGLEGFTGSRRWWQRVMLRLVGQKQLKRRLVIELSEHHVKHLQGLPRVCGVSYRALFIFQPPGGWE